MRRMFAMALAAASGLALAPAQAQPRELDYARSWVLARCLAAAAGDASPLQRSDAQASAAAILERSALRPEAFERLEALVAPALASAPPASTGARLGVLACIALRDSPQVPAALAQARKRR